MSFILTADSGCDLSSEILAAHNVHVIPMKISLGNGETFTDRQIASETLSFYQKMREGAKPTSSMINSEEFIQFWTPLLEQKLPIVHIGMAAAISGTHNNAVLAARELREEHPEAEIYVVDSTSTSTGHGLLLLEAARMRDEGVAPEEVVKTIDELKPHSNAYYTTPDLTYLQRGGRVSKTAAVLGGMLHINPIMNLSIEGYLQVTEKVRGNKATMRRMLDILREKVENEEDQVLYITHADNRPLFEAYKAEIEKQFHFKDICENYIGGVIGTHTGPGLIALFWLGKVRGPRIPQ